MDYGIYLGKEPSQAIIIIFLAFFFGFSLCRMALKSSVIVSLGFSLLFMIIGILFIIIPRTIPHDPDEWMVFYPPIPGIFWDTSIDFSSKTKHMIIVFLFFILGGVFLLRILRKWMGVGLKESEKQPGLPGFKAWLSPVNLVWAFSIVFCSYLLLGYMVGLVRLYFYFLIFLLMLLAAYPALKTLTAPQSKEKIPKTYEPKQEETKTIDEFASGKVKNICLMIEEGKINSDEATNLLNALFQNSPHRQKDVGKWSPHRKLILFGASIVLIGIFLPWWETDRNVFGPKSMVSTYGLDLIQGVAGHILLISLALAVLPYLNLKMDRRALQILSLFAAGYGCLLLLDILFTFFLNISIGLLIVMLGYALQIAGLIREKTTGGFSG